MAGPRRFISGTMLMLLAASTVDTSTGYFEQTLSVPEEPRRKETTKERAARMAKLGQGRQRKSKRG